jgi:hypothetical protein
MRVAFGPFTLDTEIRQLRHGADERHLTPKAFGYLGEALVVDTRLSGAERIHITHRPPGAAYRWE